jgi:hypothetical protein
MKKSSSVQLSVVQSLTWIVLSTLIISGSAYFFLATKSKKNISRSTEIIQSIVQTGPQKEALRSEYLSEIIGLCRDFPTKTSEFDTEKAKRKILVSPLIQDAKVKIIKPSTVYVDYTVRQPIAWVYDYENVGIDKEGFLIPMYPFFAPKNLPEIYLGLAPFGQNGNSLGLLSGEWNTSLRGCLVDLAFDIFTNATSHSKDSFRIKRIDVSKANEMSLGKRELVLIIENDLYIKSQDAPIVVSHYLRLSVSSYSQALRNYIELRKKLLDTDALLSSHDNYDLIVDFRLTDLAYIEEVKPRPFPSKR